MHRQRAVGTGGVLQKSERKSLEAAASPNGLCKGRGIRRELEAQVFGQVWNSVCVEFPVHL